MNTPDDQRIAELAMKAAAGQLDPAERAEVAALEAADSPLRERFLRESTAAKALAEAAALLNSVESGEGTLPGYARGRLMGKVREKFPGSATRPPARGIPWRWLLLTASGLAVIVLAVVLFSTPRPVIQVAMLDPVGRTRSGEDTERSLLQAAWPGAQVVGLVKEQDLLEIHRGLTAGGPDFASVVYDRGLGEIRVLGRRSGRLFEKSFPVQTDLPAVLPAVQAYVKEALGR